jgi:hypothetical protein
MTPAQSLPFVMVRGSLSFIALASSLVGLTACGGGADTQTAGGSIAGAGGAGGAGQGGAFDGASGGGGSSSSSSIPCLDGTDGGLGDGGALMCDGPAAQFVTDVVSACFGPGQNVGQDQLPGAAAGPPKGGGCCSGSLDVVSLGDGGSITVAFQGNAIVDGPGPDFIVFENAFNVSGDPMTPYAELATVEVSADGVIWSTFPCPAIEYPYGSCAGWHPVYANADGQNIDPLDPTVAGGDPFDLADLGVKTARFVRIIDRPDAPGIFDLDAVGIVNALCP